ncbi:alpha/beta hydrolase [Nocardia sp. NPDC020380]|uniref:alpha/beta hydrolase n=1 Tax=Nocardia sp. NPDC020380 TaxID=3364309 RepID=UPI00379FFD91
MVLNYRSAARTFSRRSLFATTGLLGLAAAGATVGAAVNADPGDTTRTLHAVGFEPIVRTEKIRSVARGRDVDVVTILPAGVPTEGLPMSLLLHGLHGNAHTAAVGGIANVLSAAVSARLARPFGFLAVDGGDNYWHRQANGDDPMAMLLDEVPAWLTARKLGGLDGQPFACTGTSMGGFGALVYSRLRSERARPVTATAIMSPGLITTWAEMSKRKAFINEAQWTNLDPLRNIDKQGPAPVGLWVGDRDRFIDGCRKYITTARPEIGLVTPGAHTDEYWRTVTPDVVRFLNRHLT